jgi:hypothetical protein
MAIWDKHPNYTGEELRVLVKLCAQALLALDAGATQLPQDLLQFPSSRTARELVPLVQATGISLTAQQVQKAIEDDEISSRLCLKILDEVCKYPELAERIAADYEAQAKTMAIPELMLLTGALVILAIKIKSIKWGPKKKEINFYESSEAVKQFLTQLLKGPS